MIWAEKLLENKSLVFAAAAVAILAAAALILLLFRMVFGRRLRMGGNGRTRLPRLGVVDAFDLDRNRQLVIVRRDNVEHLLMIGGPNDLVIESEIIRADGRDGRLREKEPRDKELREKDLRDKEPREAIPAGGAWPPEPEPSRAPVRPAGPERRTQPPPAAVGMEPPSAPMPEDASPPAAPQPAQRPVFPLPPRRAPAFTPYPQRQPREPNQRIDPAQRVEPGAGSPVGAPRAPLATPFVRPPPRVPQEAPRPPLAPAAETASSESSPQPREASPEAGARSPESAPVAAAPEPYVGLDAVERTEPPPVPEGEKVHSFAEIFRSSSETSKDSLASDAVDTLEEEMAKLLGRGPGKS